MDPELQGRKLMNRPDFNMIRKKIFRLLLLIGAVAAFCCLFAIDYIPGGFTWQDKRIVLDEGKELSLAGKKLTLSGADGKIFWESEDGHKVQDVFATDLDGDGDKELIALLWKRGRYGPARPYWITSDEKKYSQHIFIYDINEDGSVTQKWCASDIGPVVVRMKVMEKNNAILLTEDVDDNARLWLWQSFGLKNMDNTVSFACFGDNIIHEDIYLYAESVAGGDYDFLYEPFKKDIEEADVSVIQLETMLVDKESAVGGYPSFGTPMGVGRAIADAGFDVATCANNHSMDRGLYGIDVTTGFLQQNNITCVGLHSAYDSDSRPYKVITRNGIDIALFAYTYGINEQGNDNDFSFLLNTFPEGEEQEKEFVADLKSARNEADFVIVFAHWGKEYEKEPNDYQRHMAQLMADGGVDVVVGTHPHVVQPVETIKRPDGGDMLVYYSLGNFRAAQGFSEDTKTGAEALFTIEHCYDGVRLAGYEIKEIDAYWKDALDN